MTPKAYASALGALFAMFSQVCCAMGWIGTDLAGAPCSGSLQGYGPYDYTDPRTRKGGGDAPLNLVERYHFTRDVESLVGGNTSLGPEGDLNYTITAFPNHHRALRSVIEWATSGPNGASRRPVFKTPPECYLQRGMAFAPRDPNVPLLYGIYLHRLKKNVEAREMYEKALKLAPGFAEAHYNLGLLLTDLMAYEEARKHAQLAYKAGYPLPGLRLRLEQAGHAP